MIIVLDFLILILKTIMIKILIDLVINNIVIDIFHFFNFRMWLLF